MRIRLEDARFEPVAWRESSTFSPEALGLPDGAALTPVEVVGRLSYSEPSWLLSLGLDFRLTAVCDRCLKQFDQAVSASADLVVIRQSGAVGPRQGEAGLESAELEEVELTGEFLESAPLVAEQVVLAWPAHPLCREECAGLCPRCGADRNEGACSCEIGEIDPRWGALAALRDRWDGS